jgi:hypothetical protein
VRETLVEVGAHVVLVLCDALVVCRLVDVVQRLIAPLACYVVIHAIIERAAWKLHRDFFED